MSRSAGGTSTAASAARGAGGQREQDRRAGAPGRRRATAATWASPCASIWPSTFAKSRAASRRDAPRESAPTRAGNGSPRSRSKLRQHLAHRLRLLRQLRQVVPVVDRPLAEPFPRMPDRRAVAPDDRDRRRADARDQIEAGPATRHRVHRALQAHERAGRDRHERRGLGDKRRRAARGTPALRRRSASRSSRRSDRGRVSSRASICASSA